VVEAGHQTNTAKNDPSDQEAMFISAPPLGMLDKSQCQSGFTLAHADGV